MDYSKFNKGEEMPFFDGGNSQYDYQSEVITIKDVVMMYGKDCGNSFIKDSYPNTPVMVFNIELADKTTHIEYQLCSTTDDGDLKNPIRPSFTGKDGNEVSATTAYDFVKAIEESVGKTKSEELKKFGLSKKRFVDMPFTFDVKRVTGKDSGRLTVYLGTSRQKKKDAEYLATKAATGSYGPAVTASTTARNAGPIDPSVINDTDVPDWMKGK